MLLADVVTDPLSDPSAWLEVYGRLHLLVLHFPIALLVAAAAIELFRAAGGRKNANLISTPSLICVIIGGVGAALTASSGWIHAGFSQGPGPDDLALSLHRWIGVTGAVLGFLGAFMAIVSRLAAGPLLVAWTRVVMLLAGVTVGVAAHFGGSLTHGSGFVLAPLMRHETPGPPLDSAIAAVVPSQDVDETIHADEEAVSDTSGGAVVPIDFDTQVRPILEANCFRCHGPDRQRADLRLDVMNQVLGKLTPGDAGASTLVQVLLLPEDDDLHMPRNKPSLADHQIQLISQWIAQLEPVAVQEPPVEIDVPTAPLEVDAEPALTYPTLDDVQRAARDVAIERLIEHGISAKLVAQDMDGVEVRVESNRQSFGDEDLALLEGLEPALVILDVTGTNLTDAGLESIGRFTQLHRLRIGETKITDDGLARLADLDALIVLDVHMTTVTDSALASLLELESLWRVYAWQTGVTQDGVDMVGLMAPGLHILRD